MTVRSEASMVNKQTNMQETYQPIWIIYYTEMHLFSKILHQFPVGPPFYHHDNNPVRIDEW